MNYELFGTLVGALYLWLEYRASIYLWVAGLIMPAIYIFVYYDAGLYADCAINIYYLLASIYGLCAWHISQNHKSNNATPSGVGGVSHTPKHLYLWLLAVAILLTIAIAQLLNTFTDSTVALYDAITTSLSIVALWMLARKYAEQWLVWMLVDAISTVLYIYKQLYPTAILYALYTIIAIAGYRRWCHLACRP